MGNELIASRQNPLVKELQTIRDDRGSAFVFLEGPRLVEETVALAEPVELLVWTTEAEADPVIRAVQKKGEAALPGDAGCIRSGFGCQKPARGAGHSQKTGVELA